MARSDKEEDKLIEDNSVSGMVYLKGFFLIALILFGMLFVNDISKRTTAHTGAIAQSQTVSVIKNVQTQSKKYITDNFQKEGFVKGLEKTSNQVLGEATQAAELAVDKTTDTVSDYFYENTLEILINNLIEKLPERQKKQFIDRFCEKNDC